MSISLAFWLVSIAMSFTVFIFLPAWSGTVWVLKGPHPRYVEKYPQLARSPYDSRTGRLADLEARGLRGGIGVLFGFWALSAIILGFAAVNLF